MDERFRNKNKDMILRYKNICSQSSIEISENELYLLGYKKERDSDISSSILFETEFYAIEYIKEKINELRDWSENWEGWKEKENKSEEKNIYVF